MKNTLKLLSLLIFVIMFTSCEEEDPCKSETTTYTLPDGSTRTIEGPCL